MWPANDPEVLVGKNVLATFFFSSNAIMCYKTFIDRLMPWSPHAGFMQLLVLLWSSELYFAFWALGSGEDIAWDEKNSHCVIVGKEG